MPYSCFIFDLDGTLVDTAPGIIHSLREMEKSQGLSPLSDQDIRSFVGPPLLQSIMRFYGVDEAAGQELINGYRVAYNHEDAGFRMSQVYPGTRELLEYIKEQGGITAVATLKQQIMADKVLETHNLSGLFDMVVGSHSQDAGEQVTKGEEIIHILEALNIPREKAVMMGDSPYDGVGAKDAGVDFVALSYGFGFSSGARDEEPYPVKFTANTPAELTAFLKANILI